MRGVWLNQSRLPGLAVKKQYGVEIKRYILVIGIQQLLYTCGHLPFFLPSTLASESCITSPVAGVWYD